MRIPVWLKQAWMARLKRGETEGLAQEYRVAGDAPVIRVEIVRAEHMTRCTGDHQSIGPAAEPAPTIEMDTIQA